MALYKEHECPLIWSWQRDRAGPVFLSGPNTPPPPPPTGIAVLSAPPHSADTALRSREGPSCEVLLIGMQISMSPALSCGETAPSCRQRVGGFSVPVTLVRATFCLSLFKDSSHTCPLRMAVRARPRACLKYSESCRVVGSSELMAVFSLRRRAMGES